jgi:hypothetical protein
MRVLFKRLFGHERDAAGKSLDRLVFGSIIVGVAVGLYASWYIAIGAVLTFIIASFFVTRVWISFKLSRMERRAAELMGKIERGGPLEPEPEVKPGLPLQVGTKVTAVRNFGPIKEGAPGIITAVADIRTLYPAGPIYSCTFADNMKITARPKDIEEDNHGYSLEELEQPDFGPILSRHMTLRSLDEWAKLAANSKSEVVRQKATMELQRFADSDHPLAMRARELLL